MGKQSINKLKIELLINCHYKFYLLVIFVSWVHPQPPPPPLPWIIKSYWDVGFSLLSYVGESDSYQTTWSEQSIQGVI